MSDNTVICEQCKRVSRGHFEIIRYDQSNVRRGAVTICSAVCLIRWTADFSKHHGAQAVTMARGLIAGLILAVKGPG
jgi:hypothetical protein